MNRLLLACIACVATLAPSFASAQTFEVPGNGGKASGIGYFSGWKCPPNNNISIVVDNGSPIPAASGVRRGDTAGACNNSGLNGYITAINFGNLGAGSHHASIRQNGVEFAAGTFTVTTFGSSFLSGAAGTYTLQNFPSAGKSATVQWSEGAQNFIITGTGGPTSTPTPAPPSAAQVRFGNNLSCSGAAYVSILSANGFSWASLSGVFSDYQSVNRVSLGPLSSTNAGCGTITYPGTFSLTPGRRYALVQDFVDGSPVLHQFDEGVALTAAESSTESPNVEGLEPIATVQGVTTGEQGFEPAQ